MENLKTYEEFSDYRNVTGYGTMGHHDPQNAGPTFNKGPDSATFYRPNVIGVEEINMEDPYFNNGKIKNKKIRKNRHIEKMRKNKSSYLKKLDLETRDMIKEEPMNYYDTKDVVVFLENSHKDIDPYDEENWSDDLDQKIKIIAEIKELVERYGGCITMMDVQAESSPVHDQYGNEPYMDMHLIERLYDDKIEVVVYGGYKMETEIDEYYIQYEEVSFENLVYIQELINNAIEYDFIRRYNI